uniref:Uncharacterized protein n=1 Tax=Schistocephalus solidus TaxID=70667 RepID=A0A0X3PGW9_SCHSO
MRPHIIVENLRAIVAIKMDSFLENKMCFRPVTMKFYHLLPWLSVDWIFLRRVSSGSRTKIRCWYKLPQTRTWDLKPDVTSYIWLWICFAGLYPAYNIATCLQWCVGPY